MGSKMPDHNREHGRHENKKKPGGEQKGRMGFSPDFKDEANNDQNARIALQKSFADLQLEIRKYHAYIVELTNTLIKLENRSILNPEEHQRRARHLEQSLETLVDIERDLAAASEINLYVGVAHADKIQFLQQSLDGIIEIADQVIIEYAHLNPPEGRKVAAENQTLLNKVVDKFMAFAHLLKANLGFTAELQRDLIGDLKSIKTKNDKILSSKF
jgi:hypothetical protein